jgi:hypothetical protein
MSRRLRRSMLASAVFILAGVGGAVGNHITDKITPAAIAFVALLILGGLVALAFDHLTGNEKAADLHDAPVAPSVDARWAKAVQIGNHNVQINRDELPKTEGQVKP